MKQVQDLLCSGTLIQGTIAIIVLITVCDMYVRQTPVPSELYAVLTLVLGFYFGQHITLGGSS